MKDLINAVMEGGVVKRYHTEDTLENQSVAAHSFGVAWFVFLLHDNLPTASLLMAALSHDLAEKRTSDVSRVTRNHGTIDAQLRELEQVFDREFQLDFDINEEQQRILNLADRCEALAFCIRERRKGNSNVVPIFGRYFSKATPTTSREYSVVSALLELWKETN